MSDEESKREAMGRSRDEASFPVPPSKAGLPPDYASVLSEVKECIGQTRLRTVLAANAAMTLMYWDIGQVILKQQDEQGWGAKIVDRLSADLREEFPEMRGLSPRNLKYMRAFAAAWPDRAIVQRAVAQIPWRQNIALLEHLDDPESRLWYAEQTIAHGWSQPVLCLQIENALHAQAKLVKSLPKELKGILPTVAELEQELSHGK
jgi:predicted nuclease of restriction endonuclease-like (RecB) superfamily